MWPAPRSSTPSSKTLWEDQGTVLPVDAAFFDAHQLGKAHPAVKKEFYMLTIKGRSQRTVDAYYIDLRLFLRYLRASREHLSMAFRGLGPSTAWRSWRLSSRVKYFGKDFRWLGVSRSFRGLISKSPALLER